MRSYTTWCRSRRYPWQKCVCSALRMPFYRCDVMWCDVMWCDVMCCDVMCCDVMWCAVMWCDVLNYYHNFWIKQVATGFCDFCSVAKIFCSWGAKWHCDRQKLPAFWSLVSDGFHHGNTFLGVSTCLNFIRGLDPSVSGAKNAPIYLVLAILSSISQYTGWTAWCLGV